MAGGDSCSADAVDQALGIVAGVLLAICLMPQLWKMYSTKSARDICACVSLCGCLVLEGCLLRGCVIMSTRVICREPGKILAAMHALSITHTPHSLRMDGVLLFRYKTLASHCVRIVQNTAGDGRRCIISAHPQPNTGLIFYFAYLFRIGALVGWIGTRTKQMLLLAYTPGAHRHPGGGSVGRSAGDRQILPRKRLHQAPPRAAAINQDQC